MSKEQTHRHHTRHYVEHHGGGNEEVAESGYRASSVVPNLSPFSRHIMETPNPGKIKIPMIEHYSGITDPTNHLAAYKAQMTVQMFCESTWCRYFPTTLKGLALNWFTSFPSGIIISLSALFSQYFIAAKRHKKTNMHLMSVS